MYCHLELCGPHAHELARCLGKNPDRLFEWELSGSMVRVFFPVSTPTHARAALVFWPPASRRSSARQGGDRSSSEESAFEHFALNAHFSAALKTAFGPTVLGPRQPPPHIASRRLPLRILLSPIVTWLDPERIPSLFEPLGYRVDIKEYSRSWIESTIRRPRVFELSLDAEIPVLDALKQLMVLIPVLNPYRPDSLSYADVERLRRLGENWLTEHPQRSYIVVRNLGRRHLIQAFFNGERHATHPDPHPWSDGYEDPVDPAFSRPRSCDRWPQSIVEWVFKDKPDARRVVLYGCSDSHLAIEFFERGTLDELILAHSSRATLDRLRRRLEYLHSAPNVLRLQPTRLSFPVTLPGFRDPRMHDVDVVVIAGLLDVFSARRLPVALSSILDDWAPSLLVVAGARRPSRRGPPGASALDCGEATDALVPMLGVLAGRRAYRMRVVPGCSQDGLPLPVPFIAFDKGERGDES